MKPDCHGRYSACAKECAHCKRRAPCAHATTVRGFSILSRPRYTALRTREVQSVDTTCRAYVRAATLAKKAGFVVRKQAVYLPGTRRTFAYLVPHGLAVAVQFPDLPPRRLSEIDLDADVRCLTAPGKAARHLRVEGSIAIYATGRGAARVLTAVARTLHEP